MEERERTRGTEEDSGNNKSLLGGDCEIITRLGLVLEETTRITSTRDPSPSTLSRAPGLGSLGSPWDQGPRSCSPGTGETPSEDVVV